MAESMAVLATMAGDHSGMKSQDVAMALVAFVVNSGCVFGL